MKTTTIDIQTAFEQKAAALLSALFTAWRAADIGFAVLRNHEQLPDYISNDVDILVVKGQHAEAERLLLDLAGETGWRCQQRLQFAPATLWFQAGEAPRNLHIDLYPDLRWYGVEILPANDLLARRQPRPLFDLLDPVDEALLNLLDGLLYQGRVRDKYRPAIQRVFTGQRGTAVERLSTQIGGDQAETLADALVEGQWATVERLAPRLRRQFALRYAARKPLEAGQAVLATARRLLGRFLHPPGVFLVVAGPDGVGKSTTIARLIAQVEQSGLLNGAVVRHWRPELLPPLARLAGHPPEAPTVPGFFPPRRKPGRFQMLRLAYYAIDFVLGCWLRDRVDLAHHRLVIYDRFVLDMRVDPLRYGLSSARGVGLLWRLVPRPDRVVLLHDTPERIHARKQELTLDEIETQLAHWQHLAATGQVDSIVSVDGGPDAIARVMRHLVTETLFARHGVPYRQDTDAIGWLDSVVSPTTVCLSTTARPPSRSPSELATQTARRYAWVSLRDGRGYLLPLDNPRATRGALDIITAQSLKSRLARATIGAAARTGRLALLTRTVEARSSPPLSSNGASRTETAFDYLQSVLHLDGLAFSVALGAPGVHRTPVIQVLDRIGQTLAYAKIGWNTSTNAVVMNETETLGRLARESFTSLVPSTVLHAGWWRGRYLCVQSPLTGPGVTASPPYMTRQYLAVVQEIAGLGVTWTGLTESQFWRELSARIEIVPAGYYRHTMDTAREWLTEALGDLSLPFHYSHGDFTPWNTRQQGDRLLVFDWEYAHPAMPPGWDLMRFFLQTMVLCKKASPGVLSQVAEPDGLATGWLASHLSQLGVQDCGRPIQALFSLHLLHHLVFTALNHPDHTAALLYLTHALNLSILGRDSR